MDLADGVRSMRMLEHTQDAKAYPLVRPAPSPGMTWAEMAALEMKRHGLKPGRVPDVKSSNQYKLIPDRNERILKALKDGEMTCQALADAIGVSRRTANNYARELVLAGSVVPAGPRGGSYRLAGD